MKDRFSDILAKQEIEDALLDAQESFLLEKFHREYVNADEILDYVTNTLRTSPIDALSRAFREGNFDFLGEVVPIRHEEECKIRKHTSVQMPYAHNHDFFELIYVLRGSCRQTICTSKTSMDINQGEACLVFPPTIHKLEKIEGDEIIFKFHIPKDMFYACCPTSYAEGTQYVMFYNASEQASLSVAKLLDEYHNKNQFADVVMRNYLSLLFVELIRGKVAYNNAIIADLDKYLASNYASATLEQFASSIGYSTVYVGKIIKKLTNKTFSALLSEYKMGIVIKMLSTSDTSIGDIANAVGYSNTTGLYKSFYKCFGVTPTEYRNSILC